MQFRTIHRVLCMTQAFQKQSNTLPACPPVHEAARLPAAHRSPPSRQDCYECAGLLVQCIRGTDPRALQVGQVLPLLLKPGSENFGRRWVANMIRQSCRIASNAPSHPISPTEHHAAPYHLLLPHHHRHHHHHPHHHRHEDHH